MSGLMRSGVNVKFLYSCQGLWHCYLGGDGRILQTYGDSGVEYSYDFYLKDYLGSTRMVINSQDQITEAVAYQAYGAMIPLDSIANAPEIPAREKFTGKEFDTEGEDSANGVAGIQVYHFGARVYDPDVGVWLSVDPKEQLFYRYGYSTSPVNTVDPDGQFIWSLINTAAQWYVGNAITQGSLNPGKWNWDDPMLMAGTMITAMGMIGAAGNYFENLAYTNSNAGKYQDMLDGVGATDAVAPTPYLLR